ncbi:hypothetical protein THARTR1_02287 [Trichoderma harzianum]|uniref:Uncharacterized protein n=1 Tax=Trichoderma harzianum TaxID=5544 RepID=A0A2K0UK09_TRIHA|nr:hypothetical protein THARTR1_02287 [Trichoderma harzianum]
MLLGRKRKSSRRRREKRSAVTASDGAADDDAGGSSAGLEAGDVGGRKLRSERYRRKWDGPQPEQREIWIRPSASAGG